MAENYSINVDFAWLRNEDGKARALLAWGDQVRMVNRTAAKIEVEVTNWTEQADGSVVAVAAKGFLARTIKVDGVNREVALPEAEVKVLQVSFADVQQGDGALVQTPAGKLVTIDGGENQLFARFLASRLRDTSATKRRTIDAMVITHGDADHFAGLTKIQASETEKGLAEHKRLFVHPDRVFHNGLVKRPDNVPDLEQFGTTKKVGGQTVITDLVDSPLDVQAAQMNAPFKAWRKALLEWEKVGPITYRRLANGVNDAFDFLTAEHIKVEVLGPIETNAGGKPGLAFLAGPKDGVPLSHLNFQPGTPSPSHTINGHSVVLRITFGNLRLLFAGDLNNAAEEKLLAEHEAGHLDLQSEVLKVPHHGSHEFTPGFLKAVSPEVSVVSSGDESSRHEYIHPRATLMNALGRYSRDDASVVFVTEMVAFFEMVGMSVSAAKPKAGQEPEKFFGFKRAAFGMIRVRTDGKRLLVFTDTGKRDVKEAYAYDLPHPGALTPSEVQKA